jgi:IS30 family transposase
VHLLLFYIEGFYVDGLP